MTSRKLWTWTIEDGSLFNDPNGDLVLLTDANAAVEAAEERMYEAAYEAGKAYGMTVNGYTRGYADALTDVREAVDEAYADTEGQPSYEAVRGTIDALKTSSSRPAPTGQRDDGSSVAPAGEELRGTHDPVAEGVRLLQTIGLDITYTDEGLAVIARQMLRMGQRDEREKHHTHYCCAVCDYHVMPHRRCILR